MDDEYKKMILALPAKFVAGWEYKNGDAILLKEMTGWNEYHIGDYLLEDGKIGYIDGWECEFIPDDHEIRPVPSQELLLQIYKTKHGLQFESLALLWLANWIEDKVTNDHGFCLKCQSAEAITLLWVQETCYNMKWDGEKWI